MTDYLEKPKPPQSFKSELPLLEILDFGECTLLNTSLCNTVLIKLDFLQQFSRENAIGMHLFDTVFLTIVLGVKDSCEAISGP